MNHPLAFGTRIIIKANCRRHEIKDVHVTDCDKVFGGGWRYRIVGPHGERANVYDDEIDHAVSIDKDLTLMHLVR